MASALCCFHCIGKHSDPAFDLGVTIGADERALVRLSLQRCQRQRDAVAAELKPLLDRVEVMKLQRAEESVIAADDASSAR